MLNPVPSNRVTTEETTYLFIDGGYPQTIYRDLFVPVFGDKYEFDYLAINASFEAVRAFYYDCLDDKQKATESPTEFQARVQRQQEDLDEINSLEGVHVRYGWLSPGTKKQQKEIDVSIAVDKLTHAFYKNMTRAVVFD